MESKRPKLVTTQGLIIDGILTVLFFSFLMAPKLPVIGTNPVGILKHVPWTEAPMWVQWTSAAYCSACLAGVFWMALNLFRVTLVDQLALAGNRQR